MALGASCANGTSRDKPRKADAGSLPVAVGLELAPQAPVGVRPPSASDPKRTTNVRQAGRGCDGDKTPGAGI
jgi:hypothetical protein